MCLQTLSQVRAFVNQLAVAPDSAANDKMRQLYSDVQPFTAGFLNLFRVCYYCLLVVTLSMY